MFGLYFTSLSLSDFVIYLFIVSVLFTCNVWRAFTVKPSCKVLDTKSQQFVRAFFFCLQNANFQAKCVWITFILVHSVEKTNVQFLVLFTFFSFLVFISLVSWIYYECTQSNEICCKSFDGDGGGDDHNSNSEKPHHKIK